MGQPDPKAPRVGDTTNQALQALIANMPALTQQTIASNSQLGPALAALQQQLLQTYGPQLATTGNQIDRINQLGQAQTNLDVLSGPGMQTVQKVLEAERAANPEAYAARPQIGAALGQLLSPELSGGERTEVERSLNRMEGERGSLGTPTSTNTVAAASTFGNALRDRLGAGLQAASAVMPALNTGIDTFKIATGRDSRPNIGTSQFNTNDVANAGQGLTGGFLNNIFGMQQQANDINANRRDSLDRVTGVLGSLPNIS